MASIARPFTAPRVVRSLHCDGPVLGAAQPAPPKSQGVFGSHRCPTSATLEEVISSGSVQPDIGGQKWKVHRVVKITVITDLPNLKKRPASASRRWRPGKQSLGQLGVCDA